MIKVPYTKRIFDFILSLFLIILLLPLLILVTVLIIVNGLFTKEDRGSIFLAEKRVSQGKIFPFLKFRIFKMPVARDIMVNGARAKILEKNPENLTHAGKFFKKWGLDELPQLFNILIGHISFVGPRPAPMSEYESELQRGIMRKKMLKAGLTAGAQLLKGTKRTFDDEVALDNAYIEKCRTASSLSLLAEDVRILLHLARVAMKGTDE